MITGSAGQDVEDDAYFSLSGVTYSQATAVLGSSSNDSSSGNYHKTTSGYDGYGRLTRTVDPTGTITRTVYDAEGRVSSTWVGTSDTVTGTWSPSNAGAMTKTAAYFYDNYTGSAAVVGDGNITRTVQYPGGSADPRVTEYFYDWRDRLVAAKSGVKLSSGSENTSGEDTSTHRLITYYTYDNLGEVTQQDTYAADQVGISFSGGVPVAPSSSDLRARSTTSYDDQGRIYRTSVFAVNPSSGAVSTSSLNTNTFYDHRGDVIETAAPGAAVQKFAYDGAGRLAEQYSTNGGGDSGWSDAGNVTGDIVLSSTANTYDATGNVIFQVSKERFHDDSSSATGELGDVSTGPNARVSYQAFYYDPADRQTDAADVGTNGGSSYTRPGSVPSRSDTVHVTSTAYDAAGNVQSITDPRGIITQYAYDLAGRQTTVIDAYDAGINSGLPYGSNNQTTTYTYDGVDHVLTMTAVMPSGTDSQTTQYVYGVTTSGGSDVDSNDLLATIEYPNPSTGAASTSSSGQSSYSYDALGDATSFTDRNGSTHTYAYDVLGRKTLDSVTSLGSGVDGTIRALGYNFDSAGLPFQFTSYSDAAGTTVVNQVEKRDNGLGQIASEIQRITRHQPLRSTIRLSPRKTSGPLQGIPLAEAILLRVSARASMWAPTHRTPNSLRRLHYTAMASTLPNFRVSTMKVQHPLPASNSVLTGVPMGHRCMFISNRQPARLT